MGDLQQAQRASPAPQAGLFGNLIGDMRGGITAAVIALPVAISCGLIAFAPLGSGFASQGALAGLYTGIFVAALAALFGGSPLQISGPKSSLAVILAAVLAGLLQDPLMPAEPAARAEMALTLVFLCVVMAGLFQVLFSLLKLGNVIKFIPHPVTVGLMIGLAIIIVLSQIPIFLENHEFHWSTALTADIGLKQWAVTVAAFSMAAMLISRKWLGEGGDALFALALGSAAYYFLASSGSAGISSVNSLGGVIGAIPARLPLPHQVPDFIKIISNPDNLPLMWSVAQGAFVLGLLGAIESLLSAVAMDTHSDVHHRGNRELLGQGIGNIVSGMSGGLAGGGSPTRGEANFSAGGRTRLSGLFHAGFFLFVVAGAGQVVAMIPLAVTAGILIIYAYRLAKTWTGRLVSIGGQGLGNGLNREFSLNLVVVVLVAILTVTLDLIVAVGIGFAVASFLFVISAGQNPIYRHFRGNKVHSKNARSLEDMAILKDEGGATVIVEAQGPVFFGSAERLAERIEQFSEQADFIILDLRRVTQVDPTGGHIISRLERFLRNKGKFLLVSRLTQEMPLWSFLRDMDVIRPETQSRFFPDMDSALAWAEEKILERYRGAQDESLEISMDKLDVLSGIKKDQMHVMKDVLVREEFQKGDAILEEGDEGDAMFFVAKGTLSVRIKLAEGGRSVRLAGIGAGVVFGEMAILGGMPRTASVYADTDVICYRLSNTDFQKLGDDNPDIVIQLLLNLSRLSARRLEMTSEEVRALER